LKKNRKRV